LPTVKKVLEDLDSGVIISELCSELSLTLSKKCPNEQVLAILEQELRDGDEVVAPRSICEVECCEEKVWASAGEVGGYLGRACPGFDIVLEEGAEVLDMGEERDAKFCVPEAANQ
jgi:hypothetical protein